MRLEVGFDPFEQPHAIFLVGHFATAETQRHFRLVAFLEEADEIPQLDLVVALIRPGAELDLFDLDLLLLELGFVRLLLLAVLELAEVHELAHGRHGQRGDFHEVDFLFLRHPHRIHQGNDAELLAFFAYEANLEGGNLGIQTLRLAVDCDECKLL